MPQSNWAWVTVLRKVFVSLCKVLIVKIPWWYLRKVTRIPGAWF